MIFRYRLVFRLDLSPSKSCIYFSRTDSGLWIYNLSCQYGEIWKKCATEFLQAKKKKKKKNCTLLIFIDTMQVYREQTVNVGNNFCRGDLSGKLCAAHLLTGKRTSNKAFARLGLKKAGLLGQHFSDNDNIITTVKKKMGHLRWRRFLPGWHAHSCLLRMKMPKESTYSTPCCDSIFQRTTTGLDSKFIIS